MIHLYEPSPLPYNSINNITDKNASVFYISLSIFTEKTHKKAVKPLYLPHDHFSHALRLGTMAVISFVVGYGRILIGFELVQIVGYNY